MGISARRKVMRRRRTYENTSLRLAPSSSYYVDAQAAPLDPESALKASVYVDGIRRSAYGNIAKLDPKYGFPQYRATPQTPRLRVLKCNNQGVPEPDINPVYGFYSNTSYGKRGICLDVSIDSSWVGAAGSDGSISIWSPDEDALYEFWQAKWLDGGWVSGGPNGLTYDSSAAGKVFSIKAGGRYDDVSKAVQGAYPLQNGMQVFGVTAARLMGFPFAITAQEIFNALNPDGSIKNIDAIQHTLGCATSGYHTLSNSIPTSVNSTPRFSWPATMSDNWAAYDDMKPAYDGSKTDNNQTNPATVAVSFGQLMRFPASIDFSTWTPVGWNQSWDQTPLNFARVVGRAIQRRGMRNIDTTGGSMGITAEAPQGAIHQFGYDPWKKIASMFDLTHLPGNYGSNGADYLDNILQLSHLPWEQLEVCVMDYGSDGNAPTILPEYVEPVPLKTLAIPPSAAPIMHDDYGTITDTITLTKVDHVTWLVGNNTRYAPSSFTGATRDISYTGGNVVYVRAIADQGYAVLGQTIWSFTFTG